MSDQTPPGQSGTPGDQPSWETPPAQQPPAYGQQPPAYGQQPPYAQPQYAQPPAPQYGQQPYGYGAAVAPTPGKATAALVLGIAGLVLCPLVLSIPAWILGRQSGREIDDSQGKLGGRGTATAGTVLGIIGTVWGVLAAGFLILVLVLAANADCTGTSNADNTDFHFSCS